jgi:hypothetical protein
MGLEEVMATKGAVPGEGMPNHDGPVRAEHELLPKAEQIYETHTLPALGDIGFHPVQRRGQATHRTRRHVPDQTRVRSPVVAGRALVAYVVTEVNKSENTLNSDIWIVSSEGGEPRPLTSSPKQDRHPRWSADGNGSRSNRTAAAPTKFT